MNELVVDFERLALWLVWIGVSLAGSMICAVVVGRLALAWREARRQRIEQRYRPLVGRALDGDQKALDALVKSPSRHRLAIGRLLITPLIDDRDPARIAVTRAIVDAMSLVPIADRYLRSHLWWRRALALRALGLTQVRDHTAKIVAALDDANADVRGAALDALADAQDPAALPAIVVRVHDPSLHQGRRAAALAAFGSQCEPFLLELALVDAEHRLNYARMLAICGTERSRSALCEWAGDGRWEVRAAVFEAVAHVGLDERSALLAINALESSDVEVRAMAAGALHGWMGAGDAARHLARHLDDTWPVAVHAARSLQSMRDLGRLEFEARAARSDLSGTLARQMLWEAEVQR